MRPHGHPFDRVTDLPYPPDRSAPHLVVDEGPGISGSSFASVAEALSQAGVPDSQIVFFPSWRPDPAALCSDKARDRWQRHRAFTAPFDPEIARPGLSRWKNVSAGEWRSLFFSGESEFPAVQPQHERRKFLSVGQPRVIAKFAGFGSRGRACFDRAKMLHAARFTPAPLELANGFLFSSFAAGRPVSKMSPELMRVMIRYLAHIRREFSLNQPAPLDDLFEMTAFNLHEALGISWEPPQAPAGAPACLLDGRMLVHEWIETASGFLKTDAVDHGDDHFFPGPRDIAWDVAAAAIEFSLHDQLELLDAYARISGDRDIQGRFPFYALAYSAFRFGYCQMARSAVGAGERDRFRREADRYRAAIHRYTRCERV